LLKILILTQWEKIIIIIVIINRKAEFLLRKKQNLFFSNFIFFYFFSNETFSKMYRFWKLLKREKKGTWLWFFFLKWKAIFLATYYKTKTLVFFKIKYDEKFIAIIYISWLISRLLQQRKSLESLFESNNLKYFNLNLIFFYLLSCEFI
jgi:hypothetical protein